MRMVPRATLVCLLVLSILIPSVAISNQLPVRTEKTLFPGTSTVSYAGQNFVFTTTVPIYVTFTPVDFNRIKIEVSTRTPRSGGGGYIPSSEDELQINWEDWNTVLFSGVPPEDPWDVIVDTESGYTEK